MEIEGYWESMTDIIFWRLSQRNHEDQWKIVTFGDTGDRLSKCKLVCCPQEVINLQMQ